MIKNNSSVELLDLVDENDQVIGTVAKNTANQNPKLLHREIAILIYDDLNRLLFQQRSFQKKSNPGLWVEACAGHVQKGATALSTAHRELQEELGFDTPLIFLGKYKVSLPHETHLTYWYLGHYTGQSIKLALSEVAAYKFLTKEEFKPFCEKQKYDGEDARIGKAMMKKFWAGEFNQFKN